MRKFLIVILSTISLILATALIALVTTYSKYSEWEEEFNSKLQIENIITKETLTNSYDEKVKEFTLSHSDTEYLELTESEVGQLLFRIFDQYSNENNYINQIYIQPNKNIWNICAQIHPNHIKMSPWVCTDINKDNIQSPQIYITNINIGPYSLKQNSIVEKINEGISNAILTVNENGFSGRYIENITLLEEKIVIKGSTY